MQDLLNNADFEFLQPLVSGWLGKIEAAHRARSKWTEVKDECMMFYSRSAAAMWDPNYSKKFWSGVKAPKFRITINKAFELVAVFGPSLLWEVPSRTVTAKKPVEIPPELFGQDPQAQMLMQQLQQRQTFEQSRDKVVSFLMEQWLNYTPTEQPAGGLIGQSELAVVDALVKGRGVLCMRPYKMPSSGRTLTGSFREPPENLLIDPDFKSLDEARWIAIKHTEPHWAVERRFKLEPNSLKGKATLESTWHYSELKTDESSSAHRAAGKTNDLVVWYEIFSKTGSGSRCTGMQTIVKDHLEQTVGDFAYLAITADVPYPLNCSTKAMRGGMTDADVKNAFAWPSPLWADDRWPVEVLDFYPDTESAWPIPPLAPALGELKFLNFMIPWLANRIYSSSRDFWAVAGPHVEHYTKYLNEGLDQTVIPTPTMVDDVRKVVTILQQPETRMDAWKIVELVSEQFDKRTGLTAFAYGKNEGGTQDRTAETTSARAKAVGVRPEFMQKKVAAWQSRAASVEAFLTRWFVTGEDVEPLLGPVGRYMWEQHIMSSDVELVTRQFQYAIGAASIRRPDRDRDIANYQQVLTMFGPVAQQYAATSGNYTPFNAMMKKWADFHDADLADCMIPQQEPDPQQQQMQQQMHQLQMEQMQAETAKLNADAQAAMAQGQNAGMQLQADMMQSQADMQAKQQEMQLRAAEGQMGLAIDQQKNSQQLRQTQQMGAVQLRQAKQMGDLKVQLAKKAAAAKPKPSTARSK